MWTLGSDPKPKEPSAGGGDEIFTINNQDKWTRSSPLRMDALTKTIAHFQSHSKATDPQRCAHIGSSDRRWVKWLISLDGRKATQRYGPNGDLRRRRPNQCHQSNQPKGHSTRKVAVCRNELWLCFGMNYLWHWLTSRWQWFGPSAVLGQRRVSLPCWCLHDDCKRSSVASVAVVRIRLQLSNSLAK